MLDITIAIPTYNGADRLPLVFQALQRQKPVLGLTWEVLVVDNNSQDQTPTLIQQLQTENLGFPLRYCREPQQGAAFARNRAMREAQGEWVGFVDDDVVPDEDWLLSAAAFREYSPKIGAFSGKIRGVYKGDPPRGFEKIRQFLAIRDQGNTPCLFDPENLQLPPAASLIIKRSAWLESVPAQQRLRGPIQQRFSHKRSDLFIQGEDYEPLLYIYKAGWQIWYTPTLKASHHIPSNRFERSYLLTLAKGCGLATYQLRLVLARSPLDVVVIWIRTVFGNLRRLIFHGLKYRQRIREELVPGFLWAFYWGRFLSPFVKINQKIQEK